MNLIYGGTGAFCRVTERFCRVVFMKLSCRGAHRFHFPDPDSVESHFLNSFDLQPFFLCGQNRNFAERQWPQMWNCLYPFVT